MYTVGVNSQFVALLPPIQAEFFFGTRFENLVAKTMKGNERVVPNLVS